MALTEERIKEIEDLANEFFISKNALTHLVANNLFLFYKLTEILYTNLSCFEKEERYEIEPRTFAKMTPLENIEIIKDFYKECGIDIDVDRLIEDGTIDFLFSDFDYISKGRNYYGPKREKLIEACNNGIITDAVVLVHELSHYRNQTSGGRFIAGDMLTEALAYFDELQFLDYLKRNGYEYESEAFRKYLYHICYKLARDMRAVLRIGLLYSDLGSLSKDSYEFCFGSTENYESDLEQVDACLNQGLYPQNGALYVLGYALSTYLYYENVNNPAIFSEIQKLHSLVETCSLPFCFQMMGLNNFDNRDYENITRCLKLAGKSF